MAQSAKSGRETVENLQMQVGVLQKETKQIPVLTSQNQKLKNTIEAQEHEKVEMQGKIEDALKERMAANSKLGDQRSKLENLIGENKTYRERLTEQDTQMKKLNK